MKNYEKVNKALFEFEEKLNAFLQGHLGDEEFSDYLAKFEGKIREIVHNLEVENYALKEKNKMLKEEVKKLEKEVSELIIDLEE